MKQSDANRLRKSCVESMWGRAINPLTCWKCFKFWLPEYRYIFTSTANELMTDGWLLHFPWIRYCRKKRYIEWWRFQRGIKKQRSTVERLQKAKDRSVCCTCDVKPRQYRAASGIGSSTPDVVNRLPLSLFRCWWTLNWFYLLFCN